MGTGEASGHLFTFQKQTEEARWDQAPALTPPVTLITYDEWRSEASLTEDVESVGGSLMWRESSSSAASPSEAEWACACVL